MFLPPNFKANVAFVVPYEWIVSVWWNGDKLAIQVAAHITLQGALIQGFAMHW